MDTSLSNPLTPTLGVEEECNHLRPWLPVLGQRCAFARAGALSDVVDQLAADPLGGLAPRNHGPHPHTA